jgi:hypothetical protein
MGADLPRRAEVIKLILYDSIESDRMSQLYEDDECNRCIKYTRFLTNTYKWTCEVCHLVEIGNEYPNNPFFDIIWGRYELACRHQAHIRCLRTWCKKNGVSCPVCGPIEEIESNQFCNRCGQFGHPTGFCNPMAYK